MFQTDHALPALLGADQYTTDAAHRQDTVLLRDGAWQLVACTEMFQRDGDYVAIERQGIPVLIRRHEDRYVAFHNVCAHRGCRLATGVGNSPKLKCPYHGWQYGPDGKTRKIPAAKENFPHFERDEYQLRSYPIHQVGSLLLVQLGEEGESIDDWNPWQETFRQATSPDRWRLILHEHLDYDCDWKIPIEGSLESYHLDEVHAATFGTAPAESDCDHRLESTGTVFSTSAREASLLGNLEAALVRGITGTFDPTYKHLHVFPNIMATLTDSLVLVYQIYPTGPSQSRMFVLGWVPRSRRWGPVGRYLAWWFGVFARRMARRVLAEDAAIFPEVQAGLNALVTDRLFGRSEERLHAFHRYWQSVTDGQ
ncbi:MAG: SRPBCC family protein [Planctomycetota bacterium]